MKQIKQTAFIAQAFGLGDIIFSMGIAKYFMKQDYKILWPVQYAFLDQLKRAYPRINFVDVSQVANRLMMIKQRHTFEDDMLIVPIRWSDTIMKVPYKDVMKAKYDMYGLDWKTWKKDARWSRHYQKEKDLMGFLGIQPGDEYNLINKRFTGIHRELYIDVKNGLKNIYMTDAIGFSLFDWAGVMEKATTLHMVSTATLYMTEVLDLKCKENHLYTRKPIEPDLSYVSYLLSKEYILHE